MASRATRAPFKATTVETAIGVYAIVAAEGYASSRRALGVCRARAADSDVSTPSTGTYWATNALGAVESATALGSGTATTAFISAAVEGTVTGNPIVFAEDRATGLAAFAGRGTLPAEPDCPATAAACTADTTGTTQAAATNDVPITPTTVVMAAVQNAVRIDPVRCADRCPRRLAALPGLRARRTKRKTACSVIRTDAVDTVQTTTATSAVVTARACSAFIPTAVQRTIAVEAVVSANGGPTGLTALLRGRALRTGCKPPRWRRSGGGAPARPIDAKEVGAALNVRGTGATGVAAAIARAIGRNAVAGADDRPTGLAAFAGRGALGAEATPSSTAAAPTRAVDADRAATAMEIRGARPTGVAATIELTVPDHAIVAADNGAPRLAAFGVCAEPGALAAQRYRVLGLDNVRRADAKPGRCKPGGKSLEHAAPGSASGNRPR